MNLEKLLFEKFSRRELLLVTAGVLGLTGHKSVENNSNEAKNYEGYNSTFNTIDKTNYLLHLSMDIEAYGKNRNHIPYAIKNVCKNIDFLEENLGVHAKYTLFVTEDCAYDINTILALDDALESYSNRLYIGSHGRHTGKDVHALSEKETADFVRASKFSWKLLVRGLNLKDNDIFTIRTPAHSNNPYILDVLEREIEGNIFLFNGVYNPKEEITRNSFNFNPVSVEYNNPTPIYFPFHYDGHERITNVPLTLSRLSSNGLGNYLTEFTLKESVKSHIQNVKTIKISGNNYRVLTQYVHPHDVVMDFAKERFQEGGIVSRYYKSCLNAFTDSLIKVLKEDDRIDGIKFLSPPDFRKYAISYEQYKKLYEVL